MRTSFIRFALICLAAAATVVGATDTISPRGASPGAEDRVLGLDSRCPTFTWEPVAGALFSQLVVYRLPADQGDPLASDLEAEDEVLYTEIPGGAGAWAPSAEQCLEPGGRYVWFVRAVHETAGDEVVATSEWSPGRYFEVPSTPSSEDLRQALELLRQPAAAVGATTHGPAASTDAPWTKSTTPPAGASGEKSVPTASAAIRGAHPSVSGEAYGVVGTSASPAGAGVAAANTAGGADLVLDGSADGLPDASLSQSGLDLPSASAQIFTMGNSRGGGFTLQIDGTIAGDGSLLTGIVAADADTLDGEHGSFYRDARSLNAGTLSTDRYSAYADLGAEGYLGDSPGDLARNNATRQRDLDADMLDGQHGAFYLDAANLVGGPLNGAVFSAYRDLNDEGRLDLADDGDLPTRLQADGRYVDVLGDTMSGLLYLDRSSTSLRLNITAADEAEGDVSKLELVRSGSHPVLTVDSEGDVVAASFTGDGSGLTGIESTDLDCPECVDTTDLADFGVTAAKIANGAVLSARIADGAVSTTKIADDAVTSAKIDDYTIIADDLAASSVTGPKIAVAAVASSNIEEAAITTAKIAQQAVINASIATDAVNARTLAADAVTSAEIADGAVSAADLAAGAVTATTIQDGAITAPKLAANAVSSATIADGSVADIDLATGAVSGTKLADGAVSGAKLATNAVTSAKLADAAVTSTKLAAAAVGSAAILDGGVAGIDLAAEAVSTGKIQAGAVTSTRLADTAVTATKVDSSQVQLRVSGVCSTGSAIRAIAANGSVTCETAGGGGDLTPPVELSANIGPSDGLAVLAVANTGVLPAIVGFAGYDVPAIFGQGSGVSGVGIAGTTTGASGLGVRGIASGESGVGVWAEATSPLGGIGVKGVGHSTGGDFEATSAGGGIGIRAKGGPTGHAAMFDGNVLIRDRDTQIIVIELGKGLDYAEGFDVSDTEPLAAGTVLVIDPATPGELARSRRAYDTRVAGIIAGADGLGSGVRLGAGGFDHDVALAGRVYCQVDATEHAITPGDLLTTADLPGHAMKAADPERARGAVLGKAMEPLAAGTTGRILVLVSLQ